MARYDSADENDLLRQFAELERRVKTLETQPQLGTAAINRGHLAIVQPDGTHVFEAGEINIGLPGAWGIVQRRADGSRAFFMYSLEGGTGFWSLLDKGERVLVSEDGASGQGLATPWIPSSQWVLASSAVPSGSETTTSGSFTTIYSTLYVKQHPKYYMTVIGRASDGTTSGEIRLMNITLNEAIGSIVSVPLGGFVANFILGTINGDHMQAMELALQVRRTAGAGTVGTRPLNAYGRQT